MHEEQTRLENRRRQDINECLLTAAVSDALPLTERDLHGIARLFADFGADILPDADDMAGRAHFDEAALIRRTVEGGGNRHAAFPEFLFNVERNFHIRPVDAVDLFDLGFEFIDF